jgi:hypothetical protein
VANFALFLKILSQLLIDGPVVLEEVRILNIWQLSQQKSWFGLVVYVNKYLL